MKTYELVLLALCIWREMQSGSREERIGVGSVVLNRCNHPGWWGTSIISVILHHYQFSSFNANDSNSSKFPLETDVPFQECLLIAQGLIDGTIADNTGGATLYFDKPITEPPNAWGTVTFKVQIGGTQFWLGSEPKGKV
jgi:spore germination cell wall hydrolase CwlJ-like protein